MTTVVTFLLDRTGSMESIKRETIGAFNEYLNGLRANNTGPESGDIDFTLVQFDDISIDTIERHVSPIRANALTEDGFQPRGQTNLIDAAYETIMATAEYVRQRQAQLQRELKVVVAIQTDGYENASKKHTWQDLSALVSRQKAVGWQFIFMGAGIDAYGQSARMGFNRVDTVSYGRDERSTRAAFSATGMNTANFARGASASAGYQEHQRSAFGDTFDPGAQKPLSADGDAIPSKDPQKVDI